MWKLLGKPSLEHCQKRLNILGPFFPPEVESTKYHIFSVLSEGDEQEARSKVQMDLLGKFALEEFAAEKITFW